jgi:hypothetical protein
MLDRAVLGIHRFLGRDHPPPVLQEPQREDQSDHAANHQHPAHDRQIEPADLRVDSECEDRADHDQGNTSTDAHDKPPFGG